MDGIVSSERSKDITARPINDGELGPSEVRFGLILLKNSVFGKISKIFARRARPNLLRERFGQIGLLPLM